LHRRIDGQGQRLDALAASLARPQTRLGEAKLALQSLESRLRAARLARLTAQNPRLDQLQERLKRAQVLARERAAARLSNLQTRLEAVNPRRVLERGYALVTDAQGKTVTDSAGLALDQKLDVQLHRGALEVAVVKASA
jgi:exodeoxyribonuclease VII large subunit